MQGKNLDQNEGKNWLKLCRHSDVFKSIPKEDYIPNGNTTLKWNTQTIKEFGITQKVIQENINSRFNGKN